MAAFAPALTGGAIDSLREPALRTSLAASVALHAAALLLAGAALRPLPATVFPSPGARAPLQAMLVALPMPEAPKIPERVEQVQPQPTPLPPIIMPPRPTLAPGLSMRPSATATEPEFAPLGHTSVGAVLDPTEFGAEVVALLKDRFPYTPARLPRLVDGLQVYYPVKAARTGTSHRVKVLVLLDANGSILELQASPEDPLFTASVVRALKNKQFIPADFSGKPVPYWAILDFRFDIEGPTGADGKRLN